MVGVEEKLDDSVDGGRTAENVIVVGGGPAGLAAAAALRARGIDPLVLEGAQELGASWKAHYDRLHLHTVRWLSHLPGLRISRREGKWVPRDGVVRYLKDYANHHRLRVLLASPVTSIGRSGAGWIARTNRNGFRADVVIIATGYNREPVMPRWPGDSEFAGDLLHSSRYRSGRVYTGKDVLVVGNGNSGAEIAVDLVEQKARNVWLSVRTPPNILRRDLGGFPTQIFGIGLRRLPVPIVDRIAGVTQRLTIGDLSKYGMPAPARGLYTRVLTEERIPILDVGLVGALKKRTVEVVPPIERFDGSEVVFADGRRLSPHSVIAATGYRRGLEKLLGHLGILDQKGTPRVHGEVAASEAPNLYFIGYSNPLSGNLRELGIDARRIARKVASTR